MPLQNLFLILLLPIVFYEILLVWFKQEPLTRRIAYKTITSFSFFVLIQLVLLIYEDKVVSNVVHFPIWGMMFIFYGPYLKLIFSTWQIEEQQTKYTIELNDFYSMICVFICGVFVTFMSHMVYISEVIGGVLVLSLLYYGVIIVKKIIKISWVQTKNKKRNKWLHIGLSFVLVLLFFNLSQDVKLSGLLFLLLFYVSLVFMRKNIENKSNSKDNESSNLEVEEQDEWNKEENYFRENQNLAHLKYEQTKLNEIVLQRCNIKVKDIIIENKAFLDANFKMTDLAVQTKISRYYLAQYFNVVHRMNFREYINKLRIDHVVQYIKDCKKKEKLSVNDLFLESAFNSKTSFFKSFKHVLGCTPFEYLKKCQE